MPQGGVGFCVTGGPILEYFGVNVYENKGVEEG
jgi:hypothetical protein